MSGNLFLGPVAVGSIYTRYGTRLTFLITMLMMVFPMIWLYILRKRLDVERIDIKSVEMNNLKKENNRISKPNGSNGLIKNKSVIVNDTTSDQENFLINER